MAAVRFTGWERLKKVSFTKLLRQEFDFPLDVAKAKTDALLNGGTFIIETENIERAQELVKKAKELGFSLIQKHRILTSYRVTCP